MIYCLNCGKGITEESKFCTFCGTPVPVVDPQPSNLVTPPPVYHEPVNISTPSSGAKNEFYKNVGFWGAVLVLGSSFLPWAGVGGLFDFSSSLNLINYLGLAFSETSNNAVLVMTVCIIVVLVCAAIILIDSFADFLSRRWAKFLKIIPIIIVGLIVALAVIGAAYKSDSHEFAAGLEQVGLGVWVFLLGTIILLFYKKRKKII